MPAATVPADQVTPYVQDHAGTRALHFSIRETQSQMRLDDPYALDLSYTRTMMGFLLLRPAPPNIVMVGLGGGSLAKFCHRHLPASRFEAVEINPQVLALREAFHIPPDDERLQVLLADGAQHVRQSPGSADVLIVDGFTSDGQPARLSSQRFYDDCHAALRDEGVLVVNLAPGHRLYEAYLDRLRRSFGGEVLVVPDDEGRNSVVFACRGAALARPARRLSRQATGLEPAPWEALKDDLARVHRALRARQRAA